MMSHRNLPRIRLFHIQLFVQWCMQINCPCLVWCKTYLNNDKDYNSTLGELVFFSPSPFILLTHTSAHRSLRISVVCFFSLFDIQVINNKHLGEWSDRPINLSVGYKRYSYAGCWNHYEDEFDCGAASLLISFFSCITSTWSFALPMR